MLGRRPAQALGERVGRRLWGRAAPPQALVAFGLLLLLAGTALPVVLDRVGGSREARATATAPGEVLRTSGRLTRTDRATVRFTDADGAEHTERVSVSTTRLPGEVTVRYEPADPDNAHVEGYEHRPSPVAPVVLAAGGLGLVVIGATRWLRHRGSTG